VSNESVAIHPCFATPASVWDLIHWAGTYPDAKVVLHEVERLLRSRGSTVSPEGLKAWIIEDGVDQEFIRSRKAYDAVLDVMKGARRAQA
jgi:hypothetical protein